MNQDTINKLKSLAPSIERFRNLHPDEQAWMIHLLHQTAQTSLDVLDAISNQSLTYQEIADICELHPNSVRQILNALDEGGVQN